MQDYLDVNRNQILYQRFCHDFLLHVLLENGLWVRVWMLNEGLPLLAFYFIVVVEDWVIYWNILQLVQTPIREGKWFMSCLLFLCCSNVMSNHLSEDYPAAAYPWLLLILFEYVVQRNAKRPYLILISILSLIVCERSCENAKMHPKMIVWTMSVVVKEVASRRPTIDLTTPIMELIWLCTGLVSLLN